MVGVQDPSKHSSRASTTTTVSFTATATTTPASTTKPVGTYRGSYSANGFFISWVDTPIYTDFVFVGTSMSATTSIWMGMGLSKDQSMGDDDVVVCKLSSTATNVERYYTTGTTRPGYMNPSNPTLGLSNSNVVYNGSALVCSFRRDKATGGVSQYFDINNDYFILVARGATNAGKGFRLKEPQLKN